VGGSAATSMHTAGYNLAPSSVRLKFLATRAGVEGLIRCIRTGITFHTDYCIGTSTVHPASTVHGAYRHRWKRWKAMGRGGGKRGSAGGTGGGSRWNGGGSGGSMAVEARWKGGVSTVS
jgi:hypothetical protein